MKNIKWDRIIIIVAVFCIYQLFVVPVIENHQTIFPMRINEIKQISICIEEKEEERLYMGLNDEQRKVFVDAMNQIALLGGDEANGTLAHSIMDDWKVNRYEHPPIAEVRIVYKQTFLQRKTGLDICFYEDNSFLLQEWAHLTILPFMNTVIDSRPYVYEHGCEAFADGSENQEAVKALLQLIDNQKAWFAEHQ